ncbi:hypothetical protein BJY52DRAFT_1222435 [Lactarius psammicola]|nr:hypothetical protein BJY52DRAFT_1222435 [Lactarius psammicola]
MTLAATWTTSQAEADIAYAQVARLHYTGSRVCGHDPEEDARACIDLLKAKIKNGPGTGSYGRIHGTSATVPATTVACANDVEVLDRLLGETPTSPEFVFGLLMPLADALGWITSKAGADRLAGPEYAEYQSLTGVTEMTTENAETPPSPPPSPPDGNGNTLFAAVTNLNAHPTVLRAALPPRTVLLVFSEHSDPRSMSALAVRQAECQASQNWRHGNQSSSGEATGYGGGGLRWSTADDWALEESVVQVQMGLLFVGAKT